MNLLGRTVGIGWERQSQAAIARLTVAVSLAAAVLQSVPTQRVVAGMNSARAGMASSLGVDASVHRMSNGKIAFLGGSDEVSLDVVNPDGSGLRRLIRCTIRECQIDGPVWSPDGRRIASVRYTHQTHGDVSVYVMNANGRGERRLASCRPGGNIYACEIGSLAWSPDGTRLAMARGGSLYVLDLKTGGVRRLTAQAAGVSAGLQTAGAALDPAWSPDGSRIAFARVAGLCGVTVCPTLPYIVHADGRGLRRLSAFYGDDFFFGGPQWSPDGGTIVFSAGLDSRWAENRLCRGRCPSRGIYAVNPDGSHLRLLVPAPPMGTNRLQALAGWSPDGRHILYSRVLWNDSRWPRATALWVMNANGTGRRVLYRVGELYRAGQGRIGDAIWSPDGQRIALSVVSGLFVMGAGGRHLHRLAAGGRELAWQPIP